MNEKVLAKKLEEKSNDSQLIKREKEKNPLDKKNRIQDLYDSSKRVANVILPDLE